MAEPDLFSDKELAFLAELVRQKVEFMVVDLAAAALQGAPAVTQDVDLWFRDPGSAKMRKAIEKAGAVYIPPTALNPPVLAGAGAELFDIVVHIHGLEEFEKEYRDALPVSIGGVTVRVLPLRRIIASKEATGREKDRAILPVLRDSLRTIEGEG